MASEDELLGKLSRWLREQIGPISFHTVVETGDGELLAAFVLAAFRSAARRSVIDRFEQIAGSIASEQSRSSNVILQLFDGLAAAWKTPPHQQEALLGLSGPDELAHLRQLPAAEVPTEIIERVAILLDVFTATNTLLPIPARADGWMGAPNAAPLFGGQSALDLIAERGLEGMRSVRRYLWSQF